MYEQIIGNVIDLCILLMEGFLAFYLLVVFLADVGHNQQVFELSEFDEHQNNDFYLELFMAQKEFTIKDLQKIARDNQIPGWSRLNKVELGRELYNRALL